MKLNDIKTPVSSISGIGPQLTKLLAKQNVFTVGDLLQYYPRDYEDRTKKITLNQFRLGKVHTVAQVMGQEWFGYGTMKTLKLIINDGTATAELICFNRAFLEHVLIPGTLISLTGKFEIKYGHLQSTAFEATKMDLEKDVPEEFRNHIKEFRFDMIQPLDCVVIPVYPLTEGLTQKALSKAIAKALQQYDHGIEEEIPVELREKHKLMSKQDAVRLIHQPQTIFQAQLARKTLAYEELFLFQKVILERAEKRKGTLSNTNAPQTPQIDDNQKLIAGSSQFPQIDENTFIKDLSPLQKKLLESLPFKLTADQQKVIHEMNVEIDRSYTEREHILNQLEKGLPAPTHPSFTMSRLLQGDVGSGKTLVSFFACLRIINWKGQCALMAPTELLARQHAENAAKLLEPLGIRTAFLTGNIKAAGRTQLLRALKDGEIDIVVGTHALFSNNVAYKDLQLAVIDEQHRFGVQQRQAIIEKGRYTVHGAPQEGTLSGTNASSATSVFTFEPNLLMMSATPIPQSLALTLFGDLDVSTIHTKPLGRKEITTYLVKEGNETNAYEAVRKELEKGRQAYFVYPAINSDENIKSAERAFAHLSEHIYPQYKTALLHSKVDEEYQVKILRDFRDGNIQVLAATTVIEVGVDVPNATCMVIEQADRFGMAQLHQLRGRVGRGSEQSFCFLIYSKDITETGIERMKALRQSTDGFYIAEQDLKTRGPGELNGTLQAGALEFRIADLNQDSKLLEETRADLIALMKK